MHLYAPGNGKKVTEQAVIPQFLLCSQCLGSGQPRNPAAQLLPGHPHNLPVRTAQNLAQSRALVLMEQLGFDRCLRIPVKPHHKPGPEDHTGQGSVSVPLTAHPVAIHSQQKRAILLRLHPVRITAAVLLQGVVLEIDIGPKGGQVDLHLLHLRIDPADSLNVRGNELAVMIIGLLIEAGKGFSYVIGIDPPAFQLLQEFLRASGYCQIALPGCLDIDGFLLDDPTIGIRMIGALSHGIFTKSRIAGPLFGNASSR